MYLEQGYKITERYDVSEQVAAWLAITFHLDTLIRLKAKSSITTGTAYEVGYQADATGTLSAYAAYFPYLSVQADLETAAQQLESGQSSFDTAIGRLLISILALEPQVVAQFEPNQDEQGAIEQYLSEPVALPLIQLIPTDTHAQEAQSALVQYMGAIIGYTILRRQPFNFGSTYAIEALHASPKLVNLLAISPDDIVQMENGDTQGNLKLREILVDQASIFFTILKERSPESFAAK